MAGCVRWARGKRGFSRAHLPQFARRRRCWRRSELRRCSPWLIFFFPSVCGIIHIFARYLRNTLCLYTARGLRQRRISGQATLATCVLSMARFDLSIDGLISIPSGIAKVHIMAVPSCRLSGFYPLMTAGTRYDQTMISSTLGALVTRQPDSADQCTPVSPQNAREPSGILLSGADTFAENHRRPVHKSESSHPSRGRSKARLRVL